MTAGRNDPCPCGSGKKYKKCCHGKDQATQVAATKVAFEEAQKKAPLEHKHHAGCSHGHGDHGHDHHGHGHDHDHDHDHDEHEHEHHEGCSHDHDHDHEEGLSEADFRKLVSMKFDEHDSPWRMACDLAEAPELEELRAKDPAWKAFPALPAEVEKLSTPTIEAQLHSLGVDGRRDAFLALANGKTRAWEIGRAWMKERGGAASLARPHADFLGIAAVELWRRHLAKTPSQEMLDDLIVAGYDLLEEEDTAGAADAWWDAWQALRPRFTKDMRTIAAVAPVFLETDLLRDWLKDVADTILLLTDEDDPKWALRGLELMDALLAQFPDEGEPADRGLWRADKAAFLIDCGQDDKGRAILRALVDELPQSAVGYVRLAAELELDGERDPSQLAEAVKLLEAARARDVKDGELFALDDRLRALRKKLRRAR